MRQDHGFRINSNVLFSKNIRECKSTYTLLYQFSMLNFHVLQSMWMQLRMLQIYFHLFTLEPHPDSMDNLVCMIYE